ncbi:MAG: YihY/virulence factor BrkB family protein [Eubacteriales bacterium]|nr:YihY/virulence factor BrkB family protein [Clostridiales bacterium]MDD7307571.1 YihY/virulence factor BrkB family protein [Eubacteriales bacterium]MDY2933320.1 YihY/virulence factor BrkB family protein [Anaerovoracaceae bacterium]MEE0180486.1 YihY/virulence factor BrkB family protein [Anaerovoracaceae bacterium]
MVKSRFGQMILLGIQRFQDPYYQGFAAQMAFFYLLSIVPLIIVFSQLLDVFSISTELIEELLKQYAGGVIGDSVSGWLEGSGSVTTNIVLIATVLWSSSRAQFAMTRITNYTLTAGRSTGKGYFQERFRSIVTILITIFSLAFALIVIVFGEKILYVVLSGLEVMLNVKYEVDNVWMGLRWVFAFALYFLMVTLNYYIIPTERGRIREVLPGSIFASAGMLIVTLIYSKYTNYALSAGNYNILYGSLASIVALLFWFYFIAWVQCLGVLFNKVWKDTKR